MVYKKRSWTYNHQISQKYLNMKKIIFLITAFLFFINIGYSQPGQLDSSFGINGIVKENLGSTYDYGPIDLRQIVLRPDGDMHIIFQRAGTTFFTKRNENGLIDISFGEGGASALINIRDPHAVVQSDGKVVIAGTTNGGNSDFEVFRFNTNGTLDKSFSGDGQQITHFDADAYATAAAIQDDGKIVVAGYTSTIDDIGESSFDFTLTRYNTDGTLDKSFSNDGKTIFSANSTDDIPTSIVIQKDGKIAVVGYSNVNSQNETYSFCTIVRFNTDGSIDNSFSVDANSFGFSYIYPNSAVIQGDGKIVIAGQSKTLTGVDDVTTATSDIFVARYNTDGKLDSTFNDKGVQTIDFGSDADNAKMVKLQSDGKIVVLGNGSNGASADFVLARFDVNGRLDGTFGTNGLKKTDFENGEENANLLYIKNDGKIVAAGASNVSSLALAHYNTDGSMDTSFYGVGKTTKMFKTFQQGSTNYTSTAIQSDGKMIAAGKTYNGSNYDFAVVRYNTNGSLDSTFSNDGVQTADFGFFIDGATSVAIQKDGKIVAGGYTSDQNGGHFAMVRYNIDGSADSSFGVYGMQQNLIELGRANALVIQSDGKILLAGYLWNGSNNDIGIMRYNSNGQPDSTFGVFGILKNDFGSTEDKAAAMVLQADGKIVVTGVSNDYLNNKFILIRYNTDGSPDPAFEEKIVPVGDNQVNAIVIQRDGKIIVGGTNSSKDENNQQITDFAFARFNTNGTFDTEFGGGGIVLISADKDAVINSLVIQRNGKIIGGGVTNHSISLVRLLNTNGTLDSSFNGTGIKTLELGVASTAGIRGMAISNNKLFVAGSGQFPGTLGVAARFLLDDTLLAPIVSITTPVNDTVYAAPARIKIKAAAFDTDGTISKVEFYNDSTLLHTEYVFPYGFTWKNVPAGNYTFTVKATDNSGLVTTSAGVKVAVVPHKAPTVSITIPANHQTFAGPTTIHMGAAANDPEGTIAKVEFYNGDTLLTTERVYPYGYNWKNVPVGKYKITARATNNFGLTTVSSVVHISVLPNHAPSVSITNLANYQRFTAPGTILLVAAAIDPDGTISKLEFYSDTVLINTQYKSPYTYTWKDVPAGVYTITAKATDNLGLTKTSAPVKIIVTASDTPMVSNRPASVINLTGLNGDISLKAWPNPAGNIINIRTSGLPQNKPANISVISAMGGVMKTMQSNSSTQTTGLDVSSLVSGMYTVKVICGDKVMYKQFIKL